MIDVNELRPGNLILFDHNDSRMPAMPILRGIVERTEGDFIFFTNGDRRKKDRCDGFKLTRDILKQYGFEVHEMGDYWQAELQGIVLIQMKLQAVKGSLIDMGFLVAMPKDKAGNVLKEVHSLQNFYYDVKAVDINFSSSS